MYKKYINIQMNSLKEKITHIKNIFQGLDFQEEEHKYFYDSTELISVSGFIKNYVTPFDERKIAGFIAKKEGVSVEDILYRWKVIRDTACNKGTVIHLFGENYMMDRGFLANVFEYPELAGYFKAVKNFWEEMPDYLVPVFPELQMFCVKWGLAGTADILLYNTLTNKFVIADYKTNVDLFKNHKGQKLLGVFKNLLDSPFSKYTIQLSTYQVMFEEMTGFEVESRILVWLKPDGTYVNYFLDDIRDTVKVELTLNNLK